MGSKNSFANLSQKNYKNYYFVLIGIFIFDGLRGASNRFLGLSGIDSFNQLLIDKIINLGHFFKFSGAPIKLFLYLIPFIGITLIEFFIVSRDKELGFKDTSLAKLRNKEDTNFSDIWYFSFHLLTYLFPFMITIFSLGISSADSSLNNSFISFYRSFIPLPENELSLVLLLLITILLTDFAGYIKHRIDHGGLMWELHEFHHSATEMTIFSNYRHTYLEKITGIIPLIPLYSFATLLSIQSLSQGGYLVYFLFSLQISLSKIFNLLGHASIKVIYPKPLNYVFMSPSLHWIHHSTNPNHFDKNFGFVFVFWDKLFGTYLDESHIKDITSFGVPNTKYNKYHPIYSYFILPFNKFFGKLFSILSPKNHY